MGSPSAYSEEFRADAVRLVLDSTLPRSISDVALQLGLNRETLRSWVPPGRERAGRPCLPRWPRRSIPS